MTTGMFRSLDHRQTRILIGASLLAFANCILHGADDVRFQRMRTPLTTSTVIGSPDPPHPYRVAPVLTKLELKNPIFAISLPASKQLLFVEHSGSTSRLCRTTDDGSSGKYDELLSVDEVVYSACFHPKFADNGYVYLGANGPKDGGSKHSRVVRYTVSREAPHGIDPESRLVIIDWESNGHNGCAVVFGLDGMLYVTSGDGTSDSDTNLTGQGLDHLLAKVLRIDVDNVAPKQTYSVPKDNPFVGRKGTRPETWAYGLRNPWRMCVDPKTGHIWVGNNGQDLWEQAYLIRKGDNYGWSVYEGGHPFYLTRKLGPDAYVKPTFDHPHSEARSLTGGVVYHGKKFPDLRGAYIYGDYSTGKIWAGWHDGNKVTRHEEIADSTLQIAAFALDGDGELLVVDRQSKATLYGLEEAPKVEPTVSFPQRLSESGLFKNVATHSMNPGVIPYSVNSPLWSDGAFKQRYIAIPAEEKNKPDAKDAAKDNKPVRISAGMSGSWGFPEKTVLVKSFGFEFEDGKPESRRWIETRFLTKQQGEWVGYSYRWNDEQTDAVLVSKTGRKEQLEFANADGSKRKLEWSYPSRADCMVCHSRAAKFVLGISTAQLNRKHDYGDFAVNQLEVMEGLDRVSMTWDRHIVPHIKQHLKAEGVPEEKIKAAVEAKKQEVANGGSRWDHAPRMANPYKNSEPIELRVRSYLHANCAQCHIGAGGGNAQMDLSFRTSFRDMKLIGVKPLHDRFGVADAKLVAPKAPDQSVLLHRLMRRGPGQMPQLATNVADDRAVRLFREWINGLTQDEVDSNDD